MLASLDLRIGGRDLNRPPKLATIVPHHRTPSSTSFTAIMNWSDCARAVIGNATVALSPAANAGIGIRPSLLRRGLPSADSQWLTGMSPVWSVPDDLNFTPKAHVETRRYAMPLPR